MENPDYSRQADDYLKIEQVLQTLDTGLPSLVDVSRIAEVTGMSADDIGHVFKRWAGVSPIRFFNYLTSARTKRKLQENGRFSSQAGAVSITTKLSQGKSTGSLKHHIEYGFIPTPFGQCLLAVTGQAICYLGFVSSEEPSGGLTYLHHRYRGAEFKENQSAVEPFGYAVFTNDAHRNRQHLQLHLRGTAFQIEVWRTLLKIPPGHLVNYQDVADHIGRSSAVRAVAGAVADNPVAYVIPCHRVIAKSGKIHQYRWGPARKMAMIGYEGANTG